MFFALQANRGGYSMDWIEGEMQEQSPFTFWDLAKQRQRWIQGNYLSCISHKLSFSNVPLVVKYINFCVWFFGPVNLMGDIAGACLPFSLSKWDIFLGYLNELIYSYVFMVGIVNSFDFAKLNWFQRAFLLGPTLIWTRYLKLAESISLYLAIFQTNDQFYVVQK